MRLRPPLPGRIAQATEQKGTVPVSRSLRRLRRKVLGMIMRRRKVGRYQANRPVGVLATVLFFLVMPLNFPLMLWDTFPSTS